MGLIGEVEPKLLEAIEALDQVQVESEERAAVAEDAAGNASELYREFIESWRTLHDSLYELITVTAAEDEEAVQRNNVRQLLNVLAKKRRVMPRNLRADIIEVFKFRNVIVAQPDVLFPEATVRARIEELQRCRAAVTALVQEHT
jgi:hypothetical protein